MKRRDFLKLIGFAPLAPSILAAATPTKGFTVAELRKFVNEKLKPLEDENTEYYLFYHPALINNVEFYNIALSKPEIFRKYEKLV